jgi:hypothetical protein
MRVEQRQRPPRAPVGLPTRRPAERLPAAHRDEAGAAKAAGAGQDGSCATVTGRCGHR